MTEDLSDAEALEERLRAINSVLEADLTRLDLDDLLAELLDRVVSLLHVDTAAVLLLDESSGELVARAARGIEEEVRQGVRIRVGRGFAGRIASERRPIALDRVDATTVDNPLLWQRGIRSMLGVPLQSGGRLLGVLHVGSLADRHFEVDESGLLELVAERASAALLVRELNEERSAARVLQRSLLPSALPEHPEIDFATRYVPAEEGGVGGDWYDAFLLPSGELWIIAGDVGGHGLGPAVVMGRLRSVIRAYALERRPPNEVLALADRMLQLFEPGHIATVLSGVVHPPYDSIELASAGHLPPVLAIPGEPARLIELSVAVPLGVVPALDVRPTTVELPPGAVVVAFTDGLVERRGEPIGVGLDRVAAAVQAVDPERVCRAVMERLVGRSVPRDDIAVIALRRTDPEADIRAT